MEDMKYHLESKVSVDVIKIIMNPPLHATDNHGENGATITTNVLISRSKDGPYQAIHADLATVDYHIGVITFESYLVHFLGFHFVRIEYVFEDYLKGQILTTEFSLLVLPKPILDQFLVAPKPQFDLEEDAIETDISVGEGL